MIIFGVALILAACTEDTDGSPNVPPGNLNISSVMPDTGSGGTMVVLTGNGLGDIRSIIFEKESVPAGFQSTLNTETHLIFRVPPDAIGGEQNIYFTNSAGKTSSIPFRVLAYPSVSTASNFNFTEGTQITLEGNNLGDVQSVVIDQTGEEVTIISQEKRQIVLEFPSSTSTRSPLKLTNSTGTMTTTQEFINIDKALLIFGDTYGEGFDDGSWGDAGVISNSEFVSGTASLGKTYQQGNWHLIGFANWWPTVPYDPSYTYLTVWIKGASQDYSLYITTDASEAGFGNYVDQNKLDVKAGVWNYFKIPLADIDFWSEGKTLQQLGFRIEGPDKQDEVFYFDDVMLVK